MTSLSETTHEVLATTSSESRTPFLTVKQFCVTFSWPSESAMRAYIFQAGELGLEEAFLRIGRRVLVDPTRFFELIKLLSEQPRATSKDHLEERYPSLEGYSRSRGVRNGTLAGVSLGQGPKVRV